MDIEKEREAFLYELDGHGYSFTHNHWDNENNRFHNDQLNMVWEMWQAAKAQANKQFENFIDQAIEDSACADERRSLQCLLDEFREQTHND